MKNFTIPILFAGLATVLVLLGGLLGGVSFGLMIKRIFMYGLLMGGLGFILTFLLEKFSGESLSEPSTEMPEDFNPAAGEGTGEEILSGESGGSAENESIQVKDESGFFDYTVQDDDEIEFKPLDESVMKKHENPVLDYHGEKIEIDPKKAAQTIRQLLKEDGGNNE